MLQVDLNPDALIDRRDALVSEQLALISISVVDNCRACPALPCPSALK